MIGCPNVICCCCRCKISSFSALQFRSNGFKSASQPAGLCVLLITPCEWIEFDLLFPFGSAWVNAEKWTMEWDGGKLWVCAMWRQAKPGLGQHCMFVGVLEPSTVPLEMNEPQWVMGSFIAWIESFKSKWIKKHWLRLWRSHFCCKDQKKHPLIDRMCLNQPEVPPSDKPGQILMANTRVKNAATNIDWPGR